MFGVRADKEDKQEHFMNAARRFALDAKMFRCRAAVHVENKDDIVFWSHVLKHFRPGDRFHFVAGSRNEFGHETNGVTQCLKYFDYLSPDFFICIDSDYRYLLRERNINADHYVLQTYTYSFENHHCFAEGLDEVCARVTHLENNVFDFGRFLCDYSRILYDLFIWHLYFQRSDPSRFSKYDFNAYLGLRISRVYSLVSDNGACVLDELRMRVERKTDYLGRKYPKADLASVRDRYRGLGVTPDNVYLFVRGHNLYDMINCVCKEVCKGILRQEKGRRTATSQAISELYRNRNGVDQQLRQNIRYGAYLPIRKIEEDIRLLLEKNF